MKLSYESLEKLTIYLKRELLNKKISRFVFINGRIFSFQYFNSKQCLINLDNGNPQIAAGELNFDIKSSDETPFFQQLKKECNSSTIKTCELYNKDKIIIIKLERYNQYYQIENKFLYIELIPLKPNLILTNNDNKIILAFKERSSLNERIIQRGFAYEFPKTGQSMMQNEQDFTIEDYNKEIKNSKYDLQRINRENSYKDINNFIKRKEKTLQRKIIKLEQEEAIANKNLNFKNIADYLSINRQEIDDLSNVKFDNKVLKLDNSKSLNWNIQFLYNHYKKAKTTIEKNKIYIIKSTQEVAYLMQIRNQLEMMDNNEINQIRNELGMLQRKNKMLKPANIKANYYSLNFNGQKVLFGKNNTQNDFLTFKVAKKEDLWFHIKDLHGSHVIIRNCSTTNNKLILYAAEIVLLLAKKEDGDVIFAQKKNIHKGSFLGEAIIKKYELVHLNSIRKETIDSFKDAIKV